jgi:hypothetical protein
MVYPNPSSDYLNINIYSESHETTTIEIYNSIGVVVYQKKSTDPANAYSVERVNISRWTAGLYFVKVTTNDIQQITEVIITR